MALREQATRPKSQMRPPRVVQCAGVRRIGQYILNGLAVLSLLTCLTTIVLWARSAHHWDQASCFGRSSAFAMTSCRSQLLFMRAQYSSAGLSHGFHVHSQSAPSLAAWSSDKSARSHWYNSVGFEYLRSDDSGEIREGVVVPHYALCALSAILPASCALKHQRERRKRQAHIKMLCTSCGYDLRATPDRCPECGSVPTAAKR
jgi:hypothetical protein